MSIGHFIIFNIHLIIYDLYTYIKIGNLYTSIILPCKFQIDYGFMFNLKSKY